MQINKKFLYFIGASISFSAFISTASAAENQEYIDRDIPDSWYEAPKTASEVGIEEFHQSPMLDKRVAQGKLPPVEERLPDDPPVLEPYSETGKYGGTANLWGTGLPGWNYGMWDRTSALRILPKGGVIPFFIKDWEHSDDFKEITLHLRKGCKWSDGEPLTSDDYKYVWEHVQHNKKLSPVPPEKSDPALLDMSFKDKWTVTYRYAKPVPGIYTRLKKSMHTSARLDPAHFMKQFHPEIGDREKVEKRAEEAGIEWQEYYTRMQDSINHPEYSQMRPVLNQYVAVKRTVSSIIFERNPYYPFVDPEGNQLPYIDRIRVDLANNGKMASSKAATGEATFASRHLQTAAIPLLKRYGNKSGYKTYVFRRGYGAEVALVLNLSHPDKTKRQVFGDLRFRKAISLAINRKDINRKLYFGKAVPQQATVPPTHPLHQKRFADAYADYDPDKARQLLDEMGLKDVDDDGYRELPDGTTFNPQFSYSEMGPINPTPLLEMVISDWKDVGINFDLKMVSRVLSHLRGLANKLDATGWLMDKVVGSNLMTSRGLALFAPVRPLGYSPWQGWVMWDESDGKRGVKPPPEGKKLIRLAATVLHGTNTTERRKATTQILQSQAENLWSIGTVALAPQPVVVDNSLQNVPRTGVWAYELGYMAAYHPEQFYLEAEE